MNIQTGYPDDEHIRRVLTSVKTIAVYGASPNPMRASNSTLRFLVAAGYEVYPVNPGHDGSEIAGRRVYARLRDIPVPIDMVDVFRRSEALGGVVDEVLQMDPLPKVFWTQLDIINPAATDRAAAAGIDLVIDRCPAIEYPRLIGRVPQPATG
ncbi:MAG: CoA-binding protein [Bauldia sp.]